MVLLHTGLLVGCLAEPSRRTASCPALGWPMFALVWQQALRWWCITTWDYQWNTRRHRHPGAPAESPVGPYRLIPHPNYVAVIAEGVALPLVHTAWLTALLLLATQRCAAEHAGVRVENAALAEPDDDRPSGRRRRPGRSGHRDPRRPGRAGRRSSPNGAAARSTKPAVRG